MNTTWHDAPEWANYKATDADGQAFWYEKQPKLGGRQWDNTILTPVGKVEKVTPVKPIKWQLSLEARPGTE
jgi:hypothetical protein